MAVEFSVEHTRTSEYLFYPEDITIKPELNGRLFAPDVSDLKASILEHGQLQPVAVRSDGGKPVLIMGFSRWTAIAEINEERIKAGESRMKLRCVYVRANERDSFIANWEENRRRNATTPLDDAHHFAQLEKWGMSVKEIAERLKVSEAIVNARLALVSATPEVQHAVAEGRIKATAATKLAKLAESVQRAAVKEPGKVTPSKIAAATGQTVKPTLRDIRILVEQTADSTAEPKMVRAFCAALLKVIDGEATSLDPEE